MISLNIKFFRFLQNSLRTEFYTKTTSLTSVLYNVNLTMRWFQLLGMPIRHANHLFIVFCYINIVLKLKRKEYFIKKWLILKNFFSILMKSPVFPSYREQIIHENECYGKYFAEFKKGLVNCPFYTKNFRD